MAETGAAWLATIKRRFEAWRNWRKGTTPVELPAPAPRALSVWRSHIPLQQQGQGRRHLVCARCGAHALHMTTLQSSPCRPEQQWPKYSKTVLAAGTLDISLAALQPALQAPAIALGWKPAPSAAPRAPPQAAQQQASACSLLGDADLPQQQQPLALCSHLRPAADPGEEPRSKAARLEFLANRRELKAQDAAPCQSAQAEDFDMV